MTDIKVPFQDFLFVYVSKHYNYISGKYSFVLFCTNSCVFVLSVLQDFLSNKASG